MSEQHHTAENDALSPMEYVEANGFIDFPHAWMIARRTAPEYHHNECSFNTTGGAILCDCEVLTKSPEYVLAYVIPPAECANPECDHDRTIPSPGCAYRVTPPVEGAS